MGWLRLFLLAGCLGAVAMSAATAPWESRLVQGNHSWIMDLGRHPVWQPPAPPDYAAFRQHFERSEDFPPRNGGWVIRAGYDPAGVGLAAAAYCWPVALMCGLLYLAVRGPRRDVVLHCALHVAAGLSANRVSGCTTLFGFARLTCLTVHFPTRLSVFAPTGWWHRAARGPGAAPAAVADGTSTAAASTATERVRRGEITRAGSRTGDDFQNESEIWVSASRRSILRSV